MRRSPFVLVAAVGVGALLAACHREDARVAHPPSAPALETAAPRLEPVSGDGVGSSVAVARLGERKLAIVADADARGVRAVDTRGEQEMPVTALEGAPAQVVVARDGRVFVSLRDAAEVDVLEPQGASGFPMRVAARVSTADEPIGLALSPDGATLLVACGWGRALDAFTTRSLEHRFRVPLAREPRAVVPSEDGTRAYVSHAAASMVSVVDVDSEPHAVRLARVAPVDFSTGKDLAWRHGYALARAEFGIVAPGVAVNAGDTTVRSETYGGVDVTTNPAEVFEVAVVDAHAPGGRIEVHEEVRPQPVFPMTECLLPHAAAYDAGGEWLLVACAGSNQVMRIDARAGKSVGTPSAAWRVGAEPSGVAVDADSRTAWVWSQAARELTAVPLDGVHAAADVKEGALARVVAVGEGLAADGKIEDGPALRGRALFHKTGDARVSQDGRACASCHVDGRDDGLVWATPDGPRQTPMLAGRLAGTAPYGWNGAKGTVKKHITQTLERLGGTGLPDADMDALVAYCMKMQPPSRGSSIARVPTGATLAATHDDDPLVAEGRDLFESSRTGCASCHMADGTFTDGNRHDVKSKSKSDPARRFDTPSLRFVEGTAPYFHDGRYPTLRALLFASDGKMGHTAKLSAHEMDALEAYLRTL